jgi:hypothetical protein
MMNQSDGWTGRKTPIRTVLTGLVLAALLWAGCTARNYPGPVHGLTFDGTVQAIDIQSHRLILLPRKPSEPVSFAWDRTTKFWKNGVPIHPDEVERGASVRLHYHMVSGGPVAHHVYIQVPYAPED